MRWVDQWRNANKAKKLFTAWKADTQEIVKEQRS